MSSLAMDGRKIRLKDAVWQIVAAFFAHSISIQAGINMAYSTILLPSITNSKVQSNFTSWNATDDTVVTEKLSATRDEASWIVSLVTITTPLGSLVTGPLMDKFGRKKLCAFATIPFIISWTLAATTTTSVYTLYVARILAGVGAGLSTAVLVYVSEITHPSIRPMLLSLTSVFVSFGILLTTLLGYFLTWRIVAICCGGIAILSLMSILILPESPPWIVGLQTSDEDPNKGLKQAERSLKWLYKNESDYKHIFEELVRIKEEKCAAEKADSLFDKKDGTGRVTLKSPQAWKPLLLLFILFTLQQFTGGYIIIFYAIQIFQKSESVGMDEFTSVVIMGVVRFKMAIITLYLAKRFGRRPLLMSSGVGMAVVIAAASGWMHFVGEGVFTVVCLLLFVLFASYGVTVIPWTLLGELLPLSIRGKGSGFMVALAYIHMFVTVKLFIFVLDLVGIEFIFLTFSIFSICLVIFVYFKLPETLGKSFQEIESCFK